jgi:hypothetical protein
LAWTSDGTRIVASGITTDWRRATVMVMDAEAGDAVQLRLDVEPIWDLSISPDDRELFVSAGNQRPQYWALRRFLP